MVLLVGIYYPEGYPYDFTDCNAARYHCRNSTSYAPLSMHLDISSVNIPIIEVERHHGLPDQARAKDHMDGLVFPGSSPNSRGKKKTKIFIFPLARSYICAI